MPKLVADLRAFRRAPDFLFVFSYGFLIFSQTRVSKSQVIVSQGRVGIQA